MKHVMELPQVGGSEEAFIAAKPLLFSMGKSAIHCGGAGSGSVSYTLLIRLPNVCLTVSHVLVLCFVIRQQKSAIIWLWP